MRQRRNLFAAALVVFALLVADHAAAGTGAVDAPPIWPIPDSAPSGPPPIPDLPAATAVSPPADRIADPIRPDATCGAWHVQGSYAGRWAARSTWWGYRCTSNQATYVPHPCAGPACDAVCYGYPFDCYWITDEWADYFYWNGTDAVFAGEFYSQLIDDGSYAASSSAWWDAQQEQWYRVATYPLEISTMGSGGGVVSSTPDCGDSCDGIFNAGTTVTLTATPDASSVFTGWSGDCSGTGTCEVSIDQARWVWATFERKSFTLTVATTGTGSGLVSMTPCGVGGGEYCSQSCRACQESYYLGTVVTLTAVPDASSRFTGWSGDCSGSGDCQVTIDQARAVSATFAVTGPPTITGLFPASGLAGASVDIQGTNFSSATSSVMFNGAPASFRVDSDAWITATVPAGATSGPISVTTPEGSGTSASSFTVLGDTTPPETTIVSGPTGTTSSTSATFAFTASEPSTFACSLDEAPFAACNSPTSYAGLGDGSHTFRVRATDAAGNTDPTPAEETWTVHTNAPPQARFGFSCSALTCSFDGSGSTDPDGSITTYAWDFGDGTRGSGKTVSHTYTRTGPETVTLTVTDNAGETAAASRNVTPINLNARGYKLGGLQKVDLAWSGPTGTSFDVYRNASKIATVQGSSYTDNLNTKNPATYTYRVCAPATSTCSNDAGVTF